MSAHSIFTFKVSYLSWRRLCFSRTASLFSPEGVLLRRFSPFKNSSFRASSSMPCERTSTEKYQIKCQISLSLFIYLSVCRSVYLSDNLQPSNAMMYCASICYSWTRSIPWNSLSFLSWDLYAKARRLFQPFTASAVPMTEINFSQRNSWEYFLTASSRKSSSFRLSPNLISSSSTWSHILACLWYSSNSWEEAWKKIRSKIYKKYEKKENYFLSGIIRQCHWWFSDQQRERNQIWIHHGFVIYMFT